MRFAPLLLLALVAVGCGDKTTNPVSVIPADPVVDPVVVPPSGDSNSNTNSNDININITITPPGGSSSTATRG